MKLYSQSGGNEAVELYSQVAQSETVELFSQHNESKPVEIVSQPESVNIISQYDINDLVRIAFYTVKKGVRTRQVIALEGFMVNALMLATGITKQDVPKWIQDAVNNWGAFDSALPITKQVKFLIIRELTTQLERLPAALPE